MAEPAAPPPPTETEATFSIQRDEAGGAGYQTACIQPPAPHGPVMAIAAVADSGRAAEAGIREAHVGWIVTHVDGQAVAGEDAATALDVTRQPNRRFQVTVRQPKSGEYTVEKNHQTGEIQCRRYIDFRDIDINFNATPQGTQVSIRMSATMHRMLTSEFGSLEALQERISRTMQRTLEELETLRNGMSDEERKELEAEQAKAGERDTEASSDAERCAVCLTSQKTVVLLPCRHCSTCFRCTVGVRRVGACPICRADIAETKEVADLKDGDVVYDS